MKILFLDQSGTLGGAELCLLDIARAYKNQCSVGLFSDGPFRTLLEQNDITVEVFTTQSIQVRKESRFLTSLKSIGQILPLVRRIALKAVDYDFIYANTAKALVIGGLASVLSRRPLIYHLHDIISSEHFSQINQWVLITLANQCASLVIANSQASKKAFITAGGKPQLCKVIYNGFDISRYDIDPAAAHRTREDLGLNDCFLVGHFSRLSPWKGQHILIEALTFCPEDVKVLLVGDALFGEQDYAQQLREQVQRLGLHHRVIFLGFRSDIPQLMAACDLVAHTSTAPEPFGRVIVEAMLCCTPVVAAADGGATELITPGETGWLCPANDPLKLADIILSCRSLTEHSQQVAKRAYVEACSRFNVDQVNQLIYQSLVEKMTSR